MGAATSARCSDLSERVDRSTVERLVGASFDEERWAEHAGEDGCVGREVLESVVAGAAAGAAEPSAAPSARDGDSVMLMLG